MATHKFYTVPLNFDNLIDPDVELVKSKRFPYLQLNKTSSLKKSIDEHIELILTTHFGEYRHNRNYGFINWEKEFENMEIDKFNTHNYPRKEIEESLKKAIENFEPRLKRVQLEILFIFKRFYRGKSIKYVVDINVRGVMVNSTEEEYFNKFQFAMGPLFK